MTAVKTVGSVAAYAAATLTFTGLGDKQMAEEDKQEAKTEGARRQGHCLCGAVKVSIGGDQTHVGACHCSMCRRWSGGPLMAIDCGTDVAFEGEDSIAVFDSSPWAERGFCTKCGSNLFYRIKQGQSYIMLAGLFDDIDGFSFASQVFIDEKPDYYAFSNKTKDMTAAQVFEYYASSH